LALARICRIRPNTVAHAPEQSPLARTDRARFSVYPAYATCPILRRQRAYCSNSHATCLCSGPGSSCGIAKPRRSITSTSADSPRSAYKCARVEGLIARCIWLPLARQATWALPRGGEYYPEVRPHPPLLGLVQGRAPPGHHSSGARDCRSLPACALRSPGRVGRTVPPGRTTGSTRWRSCSASLGRCCLSRRSASSAFTKYWV
jgi:hypothetical protein